MKPQTVAVHGATGAQGRPVVRQLVANGHQVRAITRRIADLADVDALTEAYRDVDTVVLQMPLAFDDTPLRQAESVLAALGKAGVPCVVFNTSGVLPEAQVGVPFVDARVRLRTELPTVVDTVAVLAPAAFYLENLCGAWSASLVAAGEVRYPMPAEAPIPWVAADDVAAVITELVGATDPTPAQVVAGPEDLAGTDVAARLSTVLKRTVQWRTITPAEYKDMISPHVGPVTAAGIAAGYETPASEPDPTLVRRGTTTVDTWAARQNWSA
ncbi:SDR family oxidoreductase [Actinocrispum wychmicini]|uniref:Uncharacterized protein YbjT (DUF2867 family) n=1 Tax=Actinocrispum wychmicini TaxID=1213861 RepID=A0A4R2JDS8_9PSEU|nr:NmrA family NAD(P)-binding protein [Actinocrispum wychmicini]TCO57094.1 uncharacterized protein YbjT (DUF2867 family) [Actinocrispum wychmicini]